MTKVSRLPNATVVDAYVEYVGLLWHTDCADGSSTAVRTYHPPLHRIVEGWINGLSMNDRGNKKKQEDDFQCCFFHFIGEDEQVKNIQNQRELLYIFCE